MTDTDTINAHEIARAQQALIERHADTHAELKELIAESKASRPSPWLADEVSWIKVTAGEIYDRRHDLDLSDARLRELQTIRLSLMAFHDSLEREAAERQRAAWGVAVA